MPGTAIIDAVRTVHGRYGGALKDVPLTRLAGLAVTAMLERTGIDPGVIDELVLSCRHQAGNGPNPARTIAVQSGLAETAHAHTVNMACASGLKAFWAAKQAIEVGDSDVVLVVAADSMSSMPYYGSYRLRWGGAKPADINFIDGWRDGEDPLSGLPMGRTAENVARRYGINRQAQDDWALRSHQRAARAWDNGAFATEVIAVDDPAGSLDVDETVRRDSSAERLARLKPAFESDGTVTAGNASQMADAASAALLMNPATAERLGVAPAAMLRSVAAIGVDPSYMGIGPVDAIPLAVKKAGLSGADIDLYEINEAFGAQIVQNVRALQLDEDAVNLDGGGIALGHPTGETGGRLVATTMRQLAARDLHFGVVSMCVGGGQGMAAVIERVGA